MSRIPTTEQFIEKAKNIHGDKYGYQEVCYVNAKTKVKVFCKKHEYFFLTTPCAMLGGRGCPKCGLERRVNKRRGTLENFIKKSKEVHGEQFDYSEAKYVNSHVKVKLFCRDHSIWFFTDPSNHLAGKGCPKCRGAKISAKKFRTLEEFIARAKKAHGNKYDYGKAVYLGIENKLTIICPVHGEWEQAGKHHVNGHGCPRCGFEEGSRKNRNTLEYFIKEAKKRHAGKKYDYSKAEYTNSHGSVTIICHNHKKPFRFSQHAGAHLSGSGCPKCAGNIKGNTKDYLEKVKSIFGDRYNYDRVEYNGAFENIWLECKKHGWFKKIARDVLKGSGCPDCASYGFNKSIPAILYYLKIIHEDGIFYKIGITNRTVEARFNVADTNNIEVLKVWYFNKGRQARKTEQMILKECKKLLAGRNDILASGNTEIFKCDIFS